MEILGIGPLELFFILVLVLIIFGPKEVEKAGKAVGKSLNKFIRSDTWRTINRTSQEIKTLPDRLMREAGLEDLEKMTKAELSQADNMIRQSIDADSTNSSPLGAAEKSSGPADDKPTNPPEQVRWE
jgi:Sec-independent protein translocase protein TatA